MPDPSANPYLAFSAMLMAGIDGIKNKIEPPEPVDKDLYELPPDEAAAIPTVPGSLEAVLNNLEDNHAFLTEGGVFTEDLSRPGSPTSARRSSTRSGCARRRTSSSCTFDV